MGPSGSPANADWSSESNIPNAYLGLVVRSAGDFNRDGFADLLVTAYNYPVPNNGGTLNGAGAWFAWFGSIDGLGANGTPANADVAQYCNQAAAYSGRDDAGAGDVNGDGMSDIFVAAFRYDDPETDEGVVSGWYSYYQPLYLPLVVR